MQIMNIKNSKLMNHLKNENYYLHSELFKIINTSESYNFFANCKNGNLSNYFF